jgi:hypothetical protein
VLTSWLGDRCDPNPESENLWLEGIFVLEVCLSVLFPLQSVAVMLSWSLTWWIRVMMIGVAILKPHPDK